MPGHVQSIAIAVVLAGTLLTGAAAGAPSWQTYRDPTYGFTIWYPSDWTLDVGGHRYVAIVMAPPNASGFRMNVLVTVERVPAGVTLQQLADSVLHVQQTLLHEYQILRADPYRIGGRPALMRYHTWRTNAGVQIYQIQLLTIDRGYGYAAVGTTATSPRIREEAALLFDILKSFSLP